MIVANSLENCSLKATTLCCHTNGDTIQGRRERFFFFARGRSGDGGTEADQGGPLLSGKKGWKWEDGPKWPAPVGVCGESGGGWDEGEREVVLLQTAPNGRPRAGVNWGKNGVESWDSTSGQASAVPSPSDMSCGGAGSSSCEASWITAAETLVRSVARAS